jgi:hypothetical protein
MVPSVPAQKSGHCLLESMHSLRPTAQEPVPRSAPQSQSEFTAQLFAQACALSTCRHSPAMHAIRSCPPMPVQKSGHWRVGSMHSLRPMAQFRVPQSTPQLQSELTVHVFAQGTRFVGEPHPSGQPLKAAAPVKTINHFANLKLKGPRISRSRPANALPFSGVGAAKPASRFYTMSLRRPHPLQRLVRRPFTISHEGHGSEGTCLLVPRLISEYASVV